MWLLFILNPWEGSMGFGFIGRGGVAEIIPSEKPVGIVVTPKGTYFDNEPVMINDSSNLRYDFETRGRRTLSVKWIGTQDGTMLPIWEFTAKRNPCGSIMCSRQFVGYKEFVYTQGKLTEKEAPKDLSQVA